MEKEKQAQREREAQQLQQQAREKQAQREREAQQLQQQAREKQAQAEREERERQQRALALEREKQAQREREAQQLQQKERERQTLQELKVIFEDNKVLLSEFKGVSAQFERLLNPTNTVYSLAEELVKQHRKIVSELQVLKLLLFEMQRLEISETIKPKWSFLQKDTYISMTWQQIPTVTEQWRKIAAENQTLREVAQQTIKKALTKTFLEEPEMVFIQHPNSSFAIGKFPITQREWIAIMGTNPSEFKGDRLPIGKVTWYDANQYITQLNQKTGKNYRLPTSNEWLYAAKGGQDYLYGSTNNLAEVAWYFLNSNQTVHPVGTKNPNGYGLYDTLGNVHEWCQNQWLDSPTNQLLAIVAGGSYNCNPNICNLNLSGFPPEQASEGFGFRVCMPLS